jgi:hypothetical protein
MATFKAQEIQRHTQYKQASPHFSLLARADGIFAKKLRNFCLSQHLSEENLYSGFRNAALAYFKNAEITWHQAINGKPTNHLCSSQVCCVNFLYAFADQPEALAHLLRPLYPNLKQMLPMDEDSPNHYVEFEWIGKKNYLNERTKGKRKRGANVTSADAAVMFECTDDTKHIVLIEWKYTESYSNQSIKIARSKARTDRSAIYYPLYALADFPLDKSRLPHFDDLFYDPFYQFMRQQLLANEMEKDPKLGVDKVSVLHICPDDNQAFQKITSPNLRQFGSNVVEVWHSLLVHPDRFLHVSTKQLFKPSVAENYPVLNSWWQYIIDRYSWIV